MMYEPNLQETQESGARATGVCWSVEESSYSLIWIRLRCLICVIVAARGNQWSFPGQQKE